MSDTTPIEGARAPVLSGTLATGEPWALGDGRGRAVLIEFHRGTW